MLYAPISLPGHIKISASTLLGLWVYLLSDAVIFALLLATYASMGGNYAGGPTVKEVFDLNQVFLETLVLLSSTLTCGLAVLSLSNKQKLPSLAWLGCTFLGGLGFVLSEYREFQGLIARGAGPDRSGFLSAFFTLIGTHGLHVSVGLLWLAVMALQVFIKGLTQPVQARLYCFSLFWHFLDLIWVCIFSVVYLPGGL